MLHHHGEVSEFDKEESSPGKPVWETMKVDRMNVIFTDGLATGDETKEQEARDEFLESRGFRPVRFSPEEIETDTFAFAAKTIESLTGKPLDRFKT
jgi:very-short-patch-repair endonuclease